MGGGIRISKFLVVDDSAVLRDILKTILSGHADQILTASNIKEGESRIGEHCDIDLVLTDSKFSDGDGYRLLQCVEALESPKPRMILMTQDPSKEGENRAYQLGAIGYIAKPITIANIAAILKQDSGNWIGTRRPRKRSGATACLLDRRRQPEAARTNPSQLSWFVRDLGDSGAFLETEAALPIGTKLDLAINVEGSRILVTAEVVRIQEPAWGNPGGVGVHFVNFGTDAQSYLSHYVNEAC